MTPRLDRSKPFGEVIPSGHIWQDGHYFDIHGTYLRSDGAEEAPADEAPKPEVTDQPNGEIDLAAWAKGEAKYPHFKVVQVMQDAYPDAEFGKSRAGMVGFLVSQGVVSEEEAVL